MAKSVICKYCKEAFDRDITPFMQEGTRYSHMSCFEEYSGEEAERGALWDYILKIHPSPNRAYIGKNIKRFLELGFSYEGIRLTLQYLKEVKKDNFKKMGGGIAYVEWQYQAAQHYYESGKTLESKTEKIKKGQIKKPMITTEVIIFKKKLAEKKDKFLPLVYSDEE